MEQTEADAVDQIAGRRHEIDRRQDKRSFVHELAPIIVRISLNAVSFASHNPPRQSLAKPAMQKCPDFAGVSFSQFGKKPSDSDAAQGQHNYEADAQQRWD